jgi:hypothetical protein
VASLHGGNRRSSPVSPGDDNPGRETGLRSLPTDGCVLRRRSAIENIAWRIALVRRRVCPLNDIPSGRDRTCQASTAFKECLLSAPQPAGWGSQKSVPLPREPATDHWELITISWCTGSSFEQPGRSGRRRSKHRLGPGHRKGLPAHRLCER